MNRTRMFFAIAAIVIAGTLFISWTVSRADRQLREGLLYQTELVANAINREHVKALTGTKADLNSPFYLALNEQLNSVVKAADKYRYIYLMGLCEDGQVFFLVDAQSYDDPNDPPCQPGEIYAEASEELLHLFDTQTPLTEGPLPDQWGIWISGLVPLTDPQTGETIAVLGVDVDAQDWHRKVIGRAALPATLGFALFAAFGLAVVANGHYHSQIRTEAALRQSEQQHRLLIDNAVSGVAVHQMLFDQHGTPKDYIFLSANPAFERHTGLARKDVIGRRVTEILPGIEEAPFIAIYGKVVLTGEPISFEQYSDPLDRYYDINAYKVSEGQFATVFQDITDRKQAENELEQSREQYMLAVNGSNDGIWDWNLRTNSLFLSPKWKQMIGYEDHELENVFSTFEDRIHPDDKPRVQDYLDQYLNGKFEMYEIEFRLLHCDGSYRWILARGQALYDENRIPFRMAGSHTDITDKKNAENKLLLTQFAVDRAKDGIIRIDSDASFDYVNDAACEHLGYNREELLAMSVFDVDPDFPPEAWPDHWHDIFEKKHLLIESRHRRKDGTIVPVEVSLNALEIPGNRYNIAFVRDITDRKQAEENIKTALAKAERLNLILEEQTANANHMAAAAEAANIAKSQFLANMSHEIRTPMNGIIGMTGLLLDTELTEEQREFAQIVENSSDSLLSIINDILDFSKIEAGKLDLEAIDFDIRDVLEDFGQAMAMRAHEKNLEFTCAAHPDVPSYLKGDPGRLRQILTNLVGNAVKFTDSGEVAIRVELDAITGDEAVLRFSVRDTGIGIPHAKINLLFEKFSQVDASTTRKYGGTGLGLAISKQLSEKMGGKIGVNSKEGHGSEFWFTAKLPLQSIPHQAHKKAAAICGKHILIVDDNATNLEILRVRLNSWGAQVTEAASGPAAMETMTQVDTSFDLVITDMQMPEMDGLMLGKKIRQNERFKDVPLIMMTSLGHHSSGEELSDIGFAALLTKPVRPSELYSRLIDVMGGKYPEERLQTETDSEPQSLKRTARILLAEDNITNQQVAIQLIKKLGLQADAAANGAEALKALEMIDYDLVLMDVQMPEMDGLEATRRIRDRRSAVRRHDIPIIAMTANAMQGDREKYLAAGMDDYLSKPVTPKALAEKLAKWLPGDTPPVTDELKTSSADVSGSAASPIFDQDGFLDRLMGDAETAQIVIEAFLDDIPRQIETLKTAIDAADAESIELIAHTIKGASANIGGESLREMAADIEMACKDGNLELARQQYLQIETQFNRLKEEITKHEIKT